MSMSQQCAIAVKKAADGIWGCIKRSVKRSVASRLREMVLPRYSTLVKPHLECYVQFWAPQYEKIMELLERIWRVAAKMMKGQGEMRTFSLEKTKGGSYPWM